jgi:hypothetical protein
MKGTQMIQQKQSTFLIARCCRRRFQSHLDALSVVTKCIYST